MKGKLAVTSTEEAEATGEVLLCALAEGFEETTGVDPRAYGGRQENCNVCQALVWVSPQAPQTIPRICPNCAARQFAGEDVQLTTTSAMLEEADRIHAAAMVGEVKAHVVKE